MLTNNYVNEYKFQCFVKPNGNITLQRTMGPSMSSSPPLNQYMKQGRRIKFALVIFEQMGCK
jgi:hypothetical protein